MRLVVPPPAGTFFSAWRAEPVPAARDGVGHPPSERRSQEVGAGHLARLRDASRTGRASSRPSTRRARRKAARAALRSSRSTRRRLLRSARRPVRRRGVVLGPVRRRHLFAPRQHAAADAPVPDARQQPERYRGGGRVLQPVAAALLHLDRAGGDQRPRHAACTSAGSAPACASSPIRRPSPATSPVCRFYRAPAYGDSHFYSASPAECAATAAAHPVDWIYESPNVFYIQLPDTNTGACPANTLPDLALFQPADHQPSVHGRRHDARRHAERPADVDCRRLRPGCGDHVHPCR